MKMRVIWVGMVLLVVLFAGCRANFPNSFSRIPNIAPDMPSDEEEIATILKDVQIGMETKRIYKVLAHVSRNYADLEGRDYEGLREYLSRIMDDYRTIRIRRTRPKILIHGDRARAVESFGTMAEPVDASKTPPLNLQGQLSVYFERIDDVWQIVEWGPLW